MAQLQQDLATAETELEKTQAHLRASETALEESRTAHAQASEKHQGTEVTAEIQCVLAIPSQKLVHIYIFSRSLASPRVPQSSSKKPEGQS